MKLPPSFPSLGASAHTQWNWRSIKLPNHTLPLGASRIYKSRIATTTSCSSSSNHHADRPARTALNGCIMQGQSFTSCPQDSNTLTFHMELCWIQSPPRSCEQTGGCTNNQRGTHHYLVCMFQLAGSPPTRKQDPLLAASRQSRAHTRLYSHGSAETG